MEGRDVGVLGRTVRRVDLEPPRQVGGPAEQLLVEPVAPAAAGLGERDARGDRVAEHRQRDAAAAAARSTRRRRRARRRPRCRGRPARCRAPRPGSPPVAEVVRPRREHVVDPAADDAERHGPQRDVGDDARLRHRAPASAGRRRAPRRRCRSGSRARSRAAGTARGARRPATGSGSRRAASRATSSSRRRSRRGRCASRLRVLVAASAPCRSTKTVGVPVTPIDPGLRVDPLDPADVGLVLDALLERRARRRDAGVLAPLRPAGRR